MILLSATPVARADRAQARTLQACPNVIDLPLQAGIAICNEPGSLCLNRKLRICPWLCCLIIYRLLASFLLFSPPSPAPQNSLVHLLDNYPRS